jgi:parvulin-like peptidyl-prolyl isomerase
MRALESRIFPPAALAAILGISCLAACESGERGPEASGSGSQKVGNEIVLEVEGSAYRNSDLDRYVKDNAGKGELSPASLSRLYDQFVEEKLLLAAAGGQGVTLTREEEKVYLAKLADEAPPGEAGGLAARDPHLFDRPLIEKYSSRFLSGLRVGDDEIHAYYEEHKKDFLVPERVRVSQILLDTETKAVDVLRRLAGASEEEFRKIALEESIGPEAFKGGSMGVFKAGDLPFEMEKVVLPLEGGRLSPVVESSYGYHIFRMDRRLPPQLLPEAEAAPAIRLKILDGKVKDALAAHLDELKRSLAWSSHPERLPFAYQRNLP